MKRRVTIAMTIALLLLTVISYGPLRPVAKAAGIGTTIEDFVVNDDESGGCTQIHPMVAMNNSGDAVVVWSDSRYALGLIFARRFDSDLNPVGPSFRTCDDLSSACYSPAVDMNSAGSFAVVWIREASDYFDRKIYSQLYDSDGKSIGGNVEVSDPVDGNPGFTSVAMNDDGSFVVAWVEERKGYTDELVARIMGPDGQPAGPVFQLSDPSDNDVQRYPRVAADATGNFMATWTESVGGEVFVCSFDATGAIISGPTVVNRADPDMPARTSTIAVAQSGRYVITWLITDDISGEYQPLMRLFDEAGTPLTEDVPVCNCSFSTTYYEVEIAMEESGSFTLVWTDPRNGSDDIYMREYDADGNPIGFDHPVPGAEGPDDRRDGFIASDGNSRRLIVWADRRNGHADIYGQRYSGNGAELGNGVRINDDVASAYQHNPDIACNGSGLFSIAWVDLRDPDNACYLQVFDAAGNPVGENVKLSSTDIHSSQFPAVSMDATGRTMAVWNEAGDVRAQYFDQMGMPTGADFSVNDTAYAALNMAVAMNDSGKSVIAWRIGGFPWEPKDGIYVRRCDELGTPIGPSFMANDYVDGAEFSPSAAICAHGRFVVAWYCQRDDDSSGMFAQLFDSTGVPMGSNIFVGSSEGTRSGHDPSVCMDSTGAFVVAWSARELNGDNTLCAQRYDPLGNPVGPVIIVNNDPDLSTYAVARVACGYDGNFVVAWPDRPGDDRNIYAQIYDSEGNPQGDNFIVTNPAGLPFRQEDPVVAANGASVFFGWEDTRGARTYDIYAKVCDWSTGLVICGDPDGNGSVDIDDVVCLIDHIFNGTERTDLQRSGDANGSGVVDIGDVAYLINFIFSGGNSPCDADGDGEADY